MSNLEVQNNVSKTFAFSQVTFESGILSGSIADIFSKGSILERSGVNWIAWDGVTAAAGALAVLTYEVVLEATTLTIRAAIEGKFNNNYLGIVTVATGVLTALTVQQIDSLRDYTLLIVPANELAELDNQT